MNCVIGTISAAKITAGTISAARITTGSITDPSGELSRLTDETVAMLTHSGALTPNEIRSMMEIGEIRNGDLIRTSHMVEITNLSDPAPRYISARTRQRFGPRRYTECPELWADRALMSDL